MTAGTDDATLKCTLYGGPFSAKGPVALVDRAFKDAIEVGRRELELAATERVAKAKCELSCAEAALAAIKKPIGSGRT